MRTMQKDVETDEEERRRVQKDAEEKRRTRKNGVRFLSGSSQRHTIENVGFLYV